MRSVQQLIILFHLFLKCFFIFSFSIPQSSFKHPFNSPHLLLHMVLLVLPGRILFLMAHVYQLCQIKFCHMK